MLVDGILDLRDIIGMNESEHFVNVAGGFLFAIPELLKGFYRPARNNSAGQIVLPKIETCRLQGKFKALLVDVLFIHPSLQTHLKRDKEGSFRRESYPATIGKNCRLDTM